MHFRTSLLATCIVLGLPFASHAQTRTQVPQPAPRTAHAAQQAADAAAAAAARAAAHVVAEGRSEGTDQPARSITLGQRVDGSMARGTPKAFDGTPYVLYRLQGSPGARVRIDMSSPRFDAYLMAGPRNPGLGCDEDEGCRTNDDGGGDHAARLKATIPASGTLFIAANAVEQDATGAYTLRTQTLPPAAAPANTPIRVGASASDRFTANTATDEDDKPFALWTVSGAPGERVVATMRSDKLDSLLKVGRYTAGSFNSTAENDDGAGHNDARLRFTLDDSGHATLLATAFGDDKEGDYRIEVKSLPPPAPMTTRPVSVGQAVRGTLADADWQLDDDHIAHVYQIQGNPGERVTAMLDAKDFDPVLKWGVPGEKGFVIDAENDDAEGAGTNARLTVTLDAQGAGRLIVTSTGSLGTGDYTLSLVRAPRR